MVSGKEESESGFSVLPMRYISVGYRTRCLITYDQAFLLPSLSKRTPDRKLGVHIHWQWTIPVFFEGLRFKLRTIRST